MKRRLIAAASFLGFVLAVTALIIFWAAVALSLAHFFGFRNGDGNSSHYLFWSGAGSDLGEYEVGAALALNTALIWRKHTCHHSWWCWRHPHFSLEGSPYMVCGRHHPDDQPTPKEAIELHKQLTGTVEDQ